MADAEEAGTRGDVDQAQDFMLMCDKLKEERESLLKSHDKSQWATSDAAQEKLMEVCEVCGAFLIVGDAQQRIEDHLTGKQHLGYAKLRRAVEDLYEKRRKRSGGDQSEGGSRGGGGGGGSDRRRGGYDGDRRGYRNGGDAERRNKYDRRDRDAFFGRGASGGGGGDRYERNNRQRNRDRGECVSPSLKSVLN